MTDDSPPPVPKRRRWIGRDPKTDSIIVEVADVRGRIGKGTQRRVLGLLVGPLVKFAVGAALAGAAALMAWSSC